MIVAGRVKITARSVAVQTRNKCHVLLRQLEWQKRTKGRNVEEAYDSTGGFVPEDGNTDIHINEPCYSFCLIRSCAILTQKEDSTWIP